ncbi:MAG: hypothetical protein M5U10_15950 [Candidatus Methanoperedens sp.]|nr:hypothetical protein [Candidatus Methanoperedens nitroreducens]MDJ1423388.1 hypothetical protein [Candidatus Methanoperedens sp.]
MLEFVKKIFLMRWLWSIFAGFYLVAFVKLEVRRLKEHVSWYEQKATINRPAVNNYLRANA